MSNVKVENILNEAGTALPANLLPVTASAWVNFNGSGVVTIRDQFNVASITDNATGNYTVNFASDLANGNYAVDSSYNASDSAVNTNQGGDATTHSYGVNSFEVEVFNVSTNNVDAALINTVVFGG